jgi:hypothetical protein
LILSQMLAVPLRANWLCPSLLRHDNKQICFALNSLNMTAVALIASTVGPLQALMLQATRGADVVALYCVCCNSTFAAAVHGGWSDESALKRAGTLLEGDGRGIGVYSVSATCCCGSEPVHLRMPPSGKGRIGCRTQPIVGCEKALGRYPQVGSEGDCP